MQDLKRCLLFSLVLLASLVAPTSALTCWNCESCKHKGCRDPWDPNERTGVLTCDIVRKPGNRTVHETPAVKCHKIVTKEKNGNTEGNKITLILAFGKVRPV